MVNILSIDGGGVRGVIPLRILQNIENDPLININGDQDFLYNYFDAYAGSSVGSIVLAPIVYNRESANYTAENYFSDKVIADIMPTNYNYIFIIFGSIAIFAICVSLGMYFFPRIICDKDVVSVIGTLFGVLISVILIAVVCILFLYNEPRYCGKNKTKILRKNIKKNYMQDAGEKEVLFTAYNMSKQTPTLFVSWDGKNDLVKVVDASSAAPGLFPPVKINGDFYVDGGVVTNNPTDCIYSEILRKYKGDHEKKRIKILSLGCGKPEIFEISQNITKWGQLKWVASGNIGLFIGNEEIVHMKVRNYADAFGDEYIRINGELKDLSLTNTDPAYLDSLRETADKWYLENRDKLINFFK